MKEQDEATEGTKTASGKAVDVERLVSAHRRLYIEGQRDFDRRERTISELMRESYDNLHVKAFLDAWMAGNFENLEMALCAMATQLSKENTRLRDCLLKDIATRPETPFVVKG